MPPSPLPSAGTNRGDGPDADRAGRLGPTYTPPYSVVSYPTQSGNRRGGAGWNATLLMVHGGDRERAFTVAPMFQALSPRFDALHPFGARQQPGRRIRTRFAVHHLDGAALRIDLPQSE